MATFHSSSDAAGIEQPRTSAGAARASSASEHDVPARLGRLGGGDERRRPPAPERPGRSARRRFTVRAPAGAATSAPSDGRSGPVIGQRLQRSRAWRTARARSDCPGAERGGEPLRVQRHQVLRLSRQPTQRRDDRQRPLERLLFGARRSSPISNPAPRTALPLAHDELAASGAASPMDRARLVSRRDTRAAPTAVAPPSLRAALSTPPSPGRRDSRASTDRSQRRGAHVPSRRRTPRAASHLDDAGTART